MELSRLSASGSLVDALFEPVTHLSDPSRRLFVPFLLSAALVAWALGMLRGASALASAKSLADRRVWLHRSSRADLELIALKALLRALAMTVTGASALVIAGRTVSALRSIAAPPSLAAPAWLVAALFTITAFVLEDASRFALHWLMHKVPALWAFHRVHHSAEVLTPFTLYRTHPVESALNHSRSAIVIGTVTGAFVWLFGTAVRGWELFSVDAIGFLWSLAGANLRHSHVWLSFGPRVERWLLSPAQHQIHHSTALAHLDKNFGTILALWDRLARSLYTTNHAREPLAFGLRDDRQPQRGLALLLEPFAFLLRRPSGARSASLARWIAVSASLVVAGCAPVRAADVRAKLLESFAVCTVDVHTQFRNSVDALVSATSAYAEQPTIERRDAARAAWTAAFDLWQQAELLRFGPAGDSAAPGGRALRDAIYAWPNANRCLIEEQLATRGYESAAFASAPVSVRGLAALEFLLFSTEANNICPPDHVINMSGAWAAIDASEMARRRGAYAKALSQQLATASRALLDAWTGEAGFSRQLANAGRGSALFETQTIAFGAVMDGISYVDTDTKDRRLGTPLGIYACDSETCLEAIESPYANRSRVNVRNNLRGVSRVLLGCAAANNQGFDDLLEASGAPDLAQQLRTRMAAAERAVDAIPNDSIRGPIENERASVTAAHNAIRELTSFLKMEFAVTLQISSRRVEGDTD
ncbi:MAG: sterol desaturase family protein [Myxococcales bacterium]|nr:sterol desaturase family protein [Myxococcales bacterium]